MTQHVPRDTTTRSASFGAWIKERRLLLGLTQEQLAGRVSCARITIAKIEAAERRPSEQMARRLAAALRVTPEESAMLLEWAHRPFDARPPTPARPAAQPPPAQDRLPAPLTSLIGRGLDVTTVRNLLLRAGVRVLTLVGPPGVGKTRLGLAVATALLNEFSDGVYFVPLAATSDPALVADRIAQALEYKPPPGRSSAEGLHDHLRGKRLLLLLDNFEQLLPAAGTLAGLLAASAQLKALVTSRAVLRVYGEYQFPVSPLSLPDRNHLPPVEALQHYSAVELFVQRAQAVDPRFELTAANAATIAEICTRLDGLPLAIELAAARTRMLPPEAMLAQLERRLALLVGGPRDHDPRQQTLRGAVDWSHHLLEPGEQVTFHRLAVFSGGCTFDAAEVVAGGAASDAPRGDEGAVGREQGAAAGAGDRSPITQHPSPVTRHPSPASRHPPPVTPLPVLGTIESLVDKSLAYLQGSVGEERLMMLETIREYGLEQLEQSGEAEAVRLAHAAFYLDLAEKAEEQLRGPQQKAWLDRLEREHDNLRAALAWALGDKLRATSYEPRGDEGAGGRGQGAGMSNSASLPETPPFTRLPAPGTQHSALSTRLAGALWRFWYLRGYFDEGRRWLARVLAAAPARTAARARVAIGAGRLAQEQGAYAEARALHEESVSIYQELNDKTGAIQALNNLGLTAWRQGQHHEARRFLESAYTLAVDVGDEWGQGAALTNLAIVSLEMEDLAAARRFLEEGGVLFRRVGDKNSLATVLNNLGLLSHVEGDYPRAEVLATEYLDLSRELGNRRGEAIAIGALAVVARVRGDLKRARALTRQALDLFGELGDRRMIAQTLDGLASLALLEGKPEKAAHLCGVAAHLLREMDAPLPYADQVEHDRHAAAARAVLGAERYEALYIQGQSLTMEEAIEYALRE